MQALDSLPNIGRDANAFITLQPGVAPGGQVAGSIGDQNQFLIDGGNNSSGMDGNNAVYTVSSGSVTGTTGGTPSGVMPTPIESIEEFKVGTANQTADFSGAAGGQVQMVTKRGTSQFHGSVYDFLLSSYFSANHWKNDHTPSGSLPYTPLPKTHQNRYGASIGGPVTSKDILGGKTFFFFNFEGRRFPQSQSYERTVPSALLRARRDSADRFLGQDAGIQPEPVAGHRRTAPPIQPPSARPVRAIRADSGSIP